MIILEAKKKPVTIECVEWTGNNYCDIEKFCECNCRLLNGNDLVISTLEGVHHAIIGDYIIKGVKGEFYPCKHDIFLQTYDIVNTKEV